MEAHIETKQYREELDKRLFISIFLAAILIISGCTSSRQDSKQTYEDADINHDIFSIIINNTLVSLKGWERESKLELLLGKPVSQEIEELKGDGFTGSSLKKVTYDGLEMELFAPPIINNEKQKFWIMTMKLTKENYQTSKGIGVGSTVEEVKNAYQGIEIALDGRTDPNNCAYEIENEPEYNYLRFEVIEGVVREVRIYHLIP